MIGHLLGAAVPLAILASAALLGLGWAGRALHTRLTHRKAD